MRNRDRTVDDSIHLEYGRIGILACQAGHPDAIAFEKAVQSSIEAKHFHLRILKGDDHFALRRCIVRRESSTNVAAFTLFAELIREPLEQDGVFVTLEELVPTLRRWTECALATLLENASASSEDVMYPKQMDVEFDTFDRVATRI